MACRTKLTPDLIHEAVELFKRGYMQQEIYMALGIPATTWFSWLSRGRDGKQPYAQLVQALEQAKVERRCYLRSLIQAKAEQNWVCAAWLLEREFPQLYANPAVRLKHGVDEEIEIIDN